jgi:hypothetical protein
MADTLWDIGWQEHLAELAGRDAEYREATRDFLTLAIKCERLGIRLISRLLGHQSYAADWFASVIMDRKTLGDVAHILATVERYHLPLQVPTTLLDQLRTVVKFRNRLAHDYPEFDPYEGTLSLTSGRGETETFTLEQITCKLNEARQAEAALKGLLP